MPALLLVQVQRGMPTSVPSAATTHQDITMESGHVKDVRPFLKEAFKVQEYHWLFLEFSTFALNSLADDLAKISPLASYTQSTR